MEKRHERRAVRFAVVDAIIGEALAKRKSTSAIPRALAEHEEHLSSLPEDVRGEYADDIVVGEEVLARAESSPVVREIARLENLLCDASINVKMSWQPLNDPTWQPRRSLLSAGQDYLLYDARDQEQLGCIVSIQVEDNQFRETVWVRNFEGSGIWPGTITSDMATVLALTEAVKYYGL